MNEVDARRVLLLRAFETDASGTSWSDADRDWASREAVRRAGERASGEQLIAARARLATERLAQRQPAVAALLTTGGRHGAAAVALLVLAALAGLATDVIGPAQQVNILAPPLLALMLWNLAVYAALALRTAFGRRIAEAAGPLRAGLSQVLRRTARAVGPRPPAGIRPALAQFAGDWARSAQGLHGARVATALHLAAAALAAGALASMYLRGLAFEYRAGWDSTFLDAAQVHALLAAVLGPASALSGLPLPDVPALARLRFSAGGGENAARWIHLYALTVSFVVLLPRLALATIAARRARRLARELPLPLHEPYFQRLLRRIGGQPLDVAALAYSYHLDEALRAGLAALLERGFGQPVRLAVADALPLGAEDELERHRPTLPPGASAGATVAVFALTATPERETHGAFVQALSAQLDHRMPLRILVDESGWRARFGAAGDEPRRARRRSAWQTMLADLGHAPDFVDLAAPDLAAFERALERVAPVQPAASAQSPR